MPSEKPRLVVYSDQETLDKLSIIAKEQNRSRGNLVETILKEYISHHTNEKSTL